MKHGNNCENHGNLFYFSMQEFNNGITFHHKENFKTQKNQIIAMI